MGVFAMRKFVMCVLLRHNKIVVKTTFGWVAVRHLLHSQLAWLAMCLNVAARHGSQLLLCVPDEHTNKGERKEDGGKRGAVQMAHEAAVRRNPPAHNLAAGSSSVYQLNHVMCVT
jgi:hypothetical protein